MIDGEALLNMIRREVARAVAGRKHQRHGEITSYDPKKHAAKVKFQPDGQVSGWLPIGTVWMGNQWGMFSPPSPGDHVTVHYEKGDVGSAVIVHRHWNDVDKPLEVQAGEAWMIHKGKQGFKLQNDKSFLLIGQSNTTQLFDPSGKVVIDHTGHRHTNVTGGDYLEVVKTKGAVPSRVMTENGPSDYLRAQAS